MQMMLSLKTFTLNSTITKSATFLPRVVRHTHGYTEHVQFPISSSSKVANAKSKANIGQICSEKMTRKQRKKEKRKVAAQADNGAESSHAVQISDDVQMGNYSVQSIPPLSLQVDRSVDSFACTNSTESSSIAVAKRGKKSGNASQKMDQIQADAAALAVYQKNREKEETKIAKRAARRLRQPKTLLGAQPTPNEARPHWRDRVKERLAVENVSGISVKQVSASQSQPGTSKKFEGEQDARPRWVRELDEEKKRRKEPAWNSDPSAKHGQELLPSIPQYPQSQFVNTSRTEIRRGEQSYGSGMAPTSMSRRDMPSPYDYYAPFQFPPNIGLAQSHYQLPSTRNFQGSQATRASISYLGGYRYNPWMNETYGHSQNSRLSFGNSLGFGSAPFSTTTQMERNMSKNTSAARERKDFTAAPLPVPKPTAQYVSQASSRSATLNDPQELLLILDLNGTLVYRPRRSNSGNCVLRPGCADFVTYIMQNYKVMVWSSARPENVKLMCNNVFDQRNRGLLVAEWGRDRLGLSKEQFRAKTQVYKRLDWIWDAEEVASSHPKANSGKKWDQSNTVLIDDSILKASAQPHNAVVVPEFEVKEKPEHEGVLPQVTAYLEALRWQNDVSAFMREHPFEMGSVWKDAWAAMR